MGVARDRGLPAGLEEQPRGPRDYPWRHTGQPVDRRRPGQRATRSSDNRSRCSRERPRPPAFRLVRGDRLRPLARGLGRQLPGALSIARGGDPGGRRYAAVPLVWENKLAVIDMANGAVVRQMETGIAPFAAAIDRKGDDGLGEQSRRPPAEAERAVRLAQRRSRSEQVVVDAAASRPPGTVTRIDLENGKATHTIAVGSASHRAGLGRAAQPAVRGQRQQRQRLGDRHRQRCRWCGRFRSSRSPRRSAASRRRRSRFRRTARRCTWRAAESTRSR